MSNGLSIKDLLSEAMGVTVLGRKKQSRFGHTSRRPRLLRLPLCGTELRVRHSRHWRRLKDLPMQGMPVTLDLRLSRWRCRNTGCPRKVFTVRGRGERIVWRKRCCWSDTEWVDVL